MTELSCAFAFATAQVRACGLVTFPPDSQGDYCSHNRRACFSRSKCCAWHPAQRVRSGASGFLHANNRLRSYFLNLPASRIQLRMRFTNAQCTGDQNDAPSRPLCRAVFHRSLIDTACRVRRPVSYWKTKTTCVSNRHFSTDLSRHVCSAGRNIVRSKLLLALRSQLPPVFTEVRCGLGLSPEAQIMSVYVRMGRGGLRKSGR